MFLFELSHTYSEYANYVVELIDATTGNVAQSLWLKSSEVHNDGNGVTLTGSLSKYEPGSYYVRIIAGHQGYEVQPEVNSILAVN